MKAGTIILGVFVLILISWVIRTLWREWKEGRKPSPSDLLFDLKFKIECSIIDEHSELYLVRLIKELRSRNDINKEQLAVLETQFVRRFSILHEIHNVDEVDEFSPEHIT